MKRFWIFIISAIFAIQTIAKVIDLEEAKRMALLQNPDYRAKQEAYDATRWGQISSFMKLLPSGNLSASQSQTKPAGSSLPASNEMNSQSYGINFQQPLFMGGKIWLNYKMAGYSKSSSNLALMQAKLETIATVEEKYFNVLEAKELLEINKQQRKSVENNLESAQVKFEMGMLSRAELLQFKADMAAKDTDLILRQAHYQTAMQDLKNTLNYTGNLELKASAFAENSIRNLTEISYHQLQPIVDKCIALGIKQNYTIQSMENSKKIASTGVLLAGGNSLPTIQLSLGKNWRKSWDESMKASDVNFHDSQEIRLSASIPIFPVVDNYADFTSAKFQKRKTNRELESAKNNIKLAIERAVLNLISFAKSIEQANISLEYATEFYQQMEERFENGMITSTELLDAEVVLKNARFAKTSSVYSFKKAKSVLMKNLALEDEEELYELLSK